jgi:hypothetical protein
MSLDAALTKSLRNARQVIAVGAVGGFELDVIDMMGASKPSRAQCANGKRRVWPNLTKLAADLAGVGIVAFEVRPLNYQPALVRKPRPDRRAALLQQKEPARLRSA